MSKQEALAKEFVSVLIVGWHEHSKKFGSREEAEAYWLARIKQTEKPEKPKEK